jgi:leucyl-tRNA synthetase
MIEFVNAATAAKGLSRDQLDRFVRTLAPFCPHMADELWHRLGHDGAVAHAQWSSIDQSMLHDDQIEIPVQIMGKVRAKITIPSDADQKTMEALAMADERVKELLVGKTVQKVVAIPGRMVNIVAN